MVPVQIPFLVIAAAYLARVSAIMVPTGKLGPITPPKPTPLPMLPSPVAYLAPAPVWERSDETGSPYRPPIYKYILWDFVQKYGHHTLIAREQDYYNPPPRVKTVADFGYKSKGASYGDKGTYSKNKMNYSPLQFL